MALGKFVSARELAIVMTRCARIDRRPNLRMLLIALFAITCGAAPAAEQQGRSQLPVARSVFAPVLAPAGTLVLMVPFNQGLIVAADGRQTVFNRIYCDGAGKIIEPASPPLTIAVVTGNGVVVDYPHPVPDGEMCDYIKSAPRILDIEAVVKRFLETSDVPLRSLKLEALVQLCLNELVKFDGTHPGLLVQFLGTTMFQVVLANYDVESSTTVVRAFYGRIEKNGRVTFQIAQDKSYSPETDADWLMFGEADYVSQHVLGPEGKAFYDPGLFERMKGHPISEVSREEAIALATHSLEAASKTTTVIPAPTGIGGPSEVLAIGRDPRPEKIGQ